MSFIKYPRIPAQRDSEFDVSKLVWPRTDVIRLGYEAFDAVRIDAQGRRPIALANRQPFRWKDKYGGLFNSGPELTGGLRRIVEVVFAAVDLDSEDGGGKEPLLVVETKLATTALADLDPQCYVLPWDLDIHRVVMCALDERAPLPVENDQAKSLP